jgi:hypothetical protein
VLLDRAASQWTGEADEEECMARGRPRKNTDVLLKSAEMIGWAIGGIEREIAQTRERLAALTAQASLLRSRAGLGGSKTSAQAPAAASSADETPTNGRKRRRRKMSPEARKHMSEMMKKRWAERRKGK